ncbi:MAG TPA: alpha/beta hydrolase [Eudoraea sp.]|nr:alpha/beta hydrolase [Eudoraea sp.]
MEVRESDINTIRDHSVRATLFTPSEPIGKTLVISSATGVLQGYYKKFATHFAHLGYVVYTFDYWGIGGSGSEINTLKKNLCDLKSWGSVDQAAVTDYARARDPLNELTLLTHSVGGQVLGFNPHFASIDKIILVASQSGYWRYFNGLDRPKMWLFWYALIPWLTPFFGYFPAKLLGLFENIPRCVAYEWMSWGRKKDYMMAFRNDGEPFFDKIKAPLLSLSFPKDDYAPKQAVDWLTDQFKNARAERLHYIPDPHELPKLKHFGFFRERFKHSLWALVDEWIHKT